MKQKQHKMDLDQIIQLVDRFTGPDNMTPEQALGFLEQLITELEVRCDGLKDEHKELR